MDIQYLETNSQIVAVVETNEKVITDTASALDLMANIRYEGNTNLLAISKTAVAEEFFILSSGLAGEILQKFINYHTKLAIFGDFSVYTSKPLKDFIYESNQGKEIFFVLTKEEAINRLSLAK